MTHSRGLVLDGRARCLTLFCDVYLIVFKCADSPWGYVYFQKLN